MTKKMNWKKVKKISILTLLIILVSASILSIIGGNFHEVGQRLIDVFNNIIHRFS